VKAHTTTYAVDFNHIVRKCESKATKNQIETNVAIREFNPNTIN